jgi:hypothetical protein
MKNLPLLLFAISLAAAMNAVAQVSYPASVSLPNNAVSSVPYVPPYTPAAPVASVSVSNTPKPVAHVPESSTIIAGAAMLVPLAMSMLRVLRKRVELP